MCKGREKQLCYSSLCWVLQWGKGAGVAHYKINSNFLKKGSFLKERLNVKQNLQKEKKENEPQKGQKSMEVK